MYSFNILTKQFDAILKIKLSKKPMNIRVKPFSSMYAEWDRVGASATRRGSARIAAINRRPPPTPADSTQMSV